MKLKAKLQYGFDQFSFNCFLHDGSIYTDQLRSFWIDGVDRSWMFHLCISRGDHISVF